MNIENTTETFYQKILDITGWKLSVVTKNNYKTVSTPFQRYIAEEVFQPGTNISSDEIYFSGEHPFIHIMQLKQIDIPKIRMLHSKIWNEGRSPFLAVITRTEMRLYNCYEPPVENDEEVENKLQIDRFQDIIEDLTRLKNTLHQSKIDSGKIWDESYGNKVSTKTRVDRKLVANLRFTRQQLYNGGKGLPLNVIHDLLGRTLFTFYLEDRKILTTEAYPKKPRGVNNFSDLLEYRDDTYHLFEKLKEKFNGDLFPISKAEKRQVKQEHLLQVKRCFYDYDTKSGQISIWRMFQFDFIPIELLSAIYEEFMSEEEEEKNGQVKIKENGAYYTKPMLVEFMLNEVLPWPDKNNKRFDYKILDPACGSGIFLVESYRRLIARWKFAKNKRQIDEISLRNILIYSIHGIDKDKEAIKVAAFSLYLTFLNYLEPIEIRNDYIEKKRNKLVPLIRWSDKIELEDKKNNKPGNNLFQFNTFENSDIKNCKYDIIIGNPPWKKNKPEPITARYIQNNGLPAQIVCAYINYLPELVLSDGVIALVISAKILFNTGAIYDQFRHKLFSENEVDSIINLAVVRDIMFDNATAPGAVIVYRKRKHERKSETVLYCIPKNIKAINNKQSLVIDATEVKYLPLREILKKDSKIFKVAMWGGMRDYFFIKQLQEIPSISNVFGSQNQGTGLHLKDKTNKTLDVAFKNYKVIPLNRLLKYYTSEDGLEELGNDYKKYRAINKEIFNPPILLLKRGTTDTEFCCSFADFKCVFTDRIYGLSIGNISLNHLKALVATLNSTLAMYYLFMISSTWAVDKQGDILHEEIISFPAITERISLGSINTLAKKVNEIAALFMNRQSETARIEKEIDQIIYKELAIGKFEQALIEDALNNSIALRHRFNLSKAENSVKVKSDLKSYSETLVKVLNQTLKYSKSNVWVEVLDSASSTPLHVIAVCFDSTHTTGSSVITPIDSYEFDSLIQQINQYVFEQHSESIYYRKIFKYYKKDKVYLIKPNEKRFWTISEAFNDADAILNEMITTKAINS